MKANLIIALSFHDMFRRREVELTDKTIDLSGWRPRLSSVLWGAYSPELALEAKEINAEQEKLDKRRAILVGRLAATQPALVAAAKKALKSPKP